MSLRTRLVAALLALALLPTAVFTLFTLVELDRATQGWFRPGVDRALQSAQQVSRTALTRMEATARAYAVAWKDAVPTGRLDRSTRILAGEELREAGLDFLQIYRRAGGRWVLFEQVLPTGVIGTRGADLGGELEAALFGDRVVRSSRGALAAVARLDTTHAFAVGMWVPTDFFAQVERVIGAPLLLAHALAGPIVRPLKELLAAVDRVAGGEQRVRVGPHGARELRALGMAFNAMTGRLDEARAAMAEAEREAAWREVARKLAHEFKNILTPLQLSLQMIEAETGAASHADAAPDAGSGTRANLEAALGEVAQLARLADQFSQYARLPEPHLEPLDLAQVARSAAGRPMCEGVAVTCALGEPVLVRGDVVLLARAAHNLVLNACEASPAGATVEVAARREHGHAVLEVLDRGTGLPAGLADRLFEPYVSTKRRGSGLGLSLVRDIARQHGGAVSLEDREGGGARARLVLPLTNEDGVSR